MRDRFLKIPLISVIIATHNSEATIEKCLTSLISQTYPLEKYEIIVVDDGSKDKSVELSKKLNVDKVIVTNPCSLGHARNIGVKEAQGKFLAFFDSDCIAKERWIETIAKELENNDAISGPVMNGNFDSYIAWADYLLEFSPFNEYKKRSMIDFMPGCNQACTREAFEKSGGFLDKLLSDDVYFGYRLKNAGIKIVFVPEFKMLHLCRTKIKQVKSNQELLGKYIVRNNIAIPSNFSKITKSKWYVPLFFLLRIGAKARYAIKSRKFGKFIISFPIILLGTYSCSKGVWKEFTENSQK